LILVGVHTIETILIVEDEAVIRDTVAAELRAEGYEALTATDGITALHMAREREPDLVILDILLPEIDGLSVCRAIRRSSDVPIIILTARGATLDKITGLESGADDYVVKPFSMGELLARVRANLRRTRPAEPPTRLQSGDLELDIIVRRAALNGQELYLTHKEFSLLAELMRNQGAVLSHDLLLARVWGEEYVGSRHTVAVHVRWLREKIEKDASAPKRILTVRGVGYRFER